MVELQPVTDMDRQRLFDWRKEPSVDRWMSDSISQDESLYNFWFDSLISGPDSRGWLIVHLGEPVGFLSLTGLASPNRRAEWGWYVASPAARGRGVGRAAQVLGLDIAFNDYGLERVWAQVRADNDAALRAQAAAGFRREGYLRHHLFKDGDFHDVILLGILANEWKQARGQAMKALESSNLIQR